MAEVYYFPRYKGKENFVTNTILHLLTQIYMYSPIRLNSILGEAIDPEIPLGVSIIQQKKASKSIPDGTISQEALTIRIETKVDDVLTEDQLERHCVGFSSKGDNYLLIITKNERDKKLVEKLNKKILNVRIVHNTFKELSNKIQDEFNEYEVQIKPIVDDFFKFCLDLNLIEKEGILRAVPSGSSFDLNVKYSCYRHPTSRNYTAHDYLGLYKEKSVRMIGKVSLVVDVTEKDNKLIFKKPVIGKMSDDIEERINNMAQESKKKLKWDIDEKGTRFFFVEKFYETDYKKKSKGGMQINRYFDMSDFLKEASSVEELANNLKLKIWE